jgi:hypothetical protein
MAGPRHPLKRHRRSGDGLRQTAVVVGIGASLAVGLFAAGNYMVAGRPSVFMTLSRAAVQPKAAGANNAEAYTGSILYIPDDGANCRQLLFDNRNGRFTDNGSVDCVEASSQSGIGSQKQWSAARVKVISTGFRDH